MLTPCTPSLIATLNQRLGAAEVAPNKKEIGK